MLINESIVINIISHEGKSELVLQGTALEDGNSTHKVSEVNGSCVCDVNTIEQGSVEIFILDEFSRQLDEEKDVFYFMM